MPRGWQRKSEINTWVDVSKIPGRPKWKEVEEDTGSSSTPEDNICPSSPLAPPMVDGPNIDDIQGDSINQPSGVGSGNRTQGKKQTDYMRQWLHEKRGLYVRRMIAAKGRIADPVSGILPSRCQRCWIGNAVWRCNDCLDKQPICVLCCRERHQNSCFHRIEKWNGRFYQPGALWQVGIKIYTGHNGRPCPNAGHAIHPETHIGGEVFQMVLQENTAEQFGQEELEMREEIIAGTHKRREDATSNGQEMNDEISIHNGRNPITSIPNLIEAVAEAEEAATKLQEAADRVTADAENTGETPDGNEDLATAIPFIDHVAGDDDDWEDEDERPAKGYTPRFYPRPPNRDGAGNDFLTVAHDNGFHHIPVVWCVCGDHLEDRDLQLLDLQLFPASYSNIKTVFTFACLKNQRIDNLESKTSHYQYHSKLRRLTCPKNPSSAPNRYAELRRVSRQWRNIKYRKWFWYLNDEKPTRGSMALFCPACPQPGVNLPPDWKEDMRTHPSVYMRSLVADGNFKADHLKQKNDNDDVWLTEGEGYMTATKPYLVHIANTQEQVEKPTCHRHRAQLNGEAGHNSADCSGIGGQCCARHGCFAPGSLVNFQKGEKQLNMDWSLCEALATTHVQGLQEVLHIYDISCQYYRNLQKRISRNPLLQTPDGLRLIHAIGLFHVHGHKDECLYRWATSYVPGAGIVDGEIMETLWSVLNTVSASTRTASLAHRSEVLDDHMGDSNFKKMLNITRSLIARYNRGVENAPESRRAFENLDNAAPNAEKAIWLVEIETAEAERNLNPAAMDIMHSKIKAGATLTEVTAEIRSRDSLNRNSVADDSTAIDWLLEGLNIWDEQISIRQRVRQVGRYPSPDEHQEVARKRQRIAGRIQSFHTIANRLLGQTNVKEQLGNPDILDVDGYVSDELREEEECLLQLSPSAIENTTLVFPSNIRGHLTPLLQDLRGRELLLLRAKANDALSHLRESLSGLSYQYINKVRQSSTTKQHLRAFDGVKLLTSEVSYHRQVYNRCRRSLVDLDNNLKTRFPHLALNECKISTAIADVNARGQSQVRLAWFWGAVDGYEPAIAPTIAADSSRLLEFYRVNWLRARAQKNRWDEELFRTEREMQWTVRFFMKQRDVWYDRFRGLKVQTENCHGQAAYCEEQIHLWDEFGRVADLQFRPILGYPEPVWTPLRDFQLV